MILALKYPHLTQCFPALNVCLELTAHSCGFQTEVLMKNASGQCVSITYGCACGSSSAFPLHVRWCRCMRVSACAPALCMQCYITAMWIDAGKPSSRDTDLQGDADTRALVGSDEGVLRSLTGFPCLCWLICSLIQTPKGCLSLTQEHQ